MHLDDQLGETERARNFLKETWSFLQRVQIMDSGIGPMVESNLDEVILDEFALKLARVCERTCTADSRSPFSAKFDGVLLIIDEADNCSAQLNLGSFLKLLTERLQRYGCSQILIGLAGMPELRLNCMPAILRHHEFLRMCN